MCEQISEFSVKRSEELTHRSHSSSYAAQATCGLQIESNGLSLAAPGHASGRGSSCSKAVSEGRATGSRQTPASFADSRHLLVLHLNQRTGSPAAALGHRLLVCGEVEGEEQEQVRGDDADSGNGSELLASALAHVGQLGPVGAGEVGPRSEVDEAWSS
jgi:hypothetical protein